MLISRKYKFIFIHNPKCAGTSIFELLTPYSNMMCRFQNTKFYYYSSRLFGEKEILSNFRKHIPARDLKTKVTGNTWNTHYKFGVCRNPYDRVVSTFFYFKNNNDSVLRRDYEKYANFREFVRDLPNLKWKDYQHYYLCDAKGNILVDQAIKLENLTSDLNTTLRRLNVSTVQLAHRNKSERKKKFETYFDQESTAIVNKVYRKDFEIFGYEMVGG